MEKVNRDNGCLVAIPGSHRGELLEHGYPNWEVILFMIAHQVMIAP